MDEPQDSDLRAEYDFSRAVRGKYHERYSTSTNIVVLDPDVAERFYRPRTHQGLSSPLTRPKTAAPDAERAADPDPDA